MRVAKNLMYQAMASSIALKPWFLLLSRGFPMTQMMLFDAPVGIDSVPFRPRQDSNRLAKQVRLTPRRRGSNESTCGRRPEHDRGFEHASRVEQAQAVVGENLSEDGSLHRMGDLARLVLLRYDLMAKRRARFASRRCAR